MIAGADRWDRSDWRSGVYIDPDDARINTLTIYEGINFRSGKSVYNLEKNSLQRLHNP